MNSGRSDEVGQSPWLPDFVDPADLGDVSLEASATWGEETPRLFPARGVSGADAPDDSPPRGAKRALGWGTQARQGSKKEFGSSRGGGQRPKKSKKTLTWAEKQERKEKRAEKRRAQEEKERLADPMGFAREIVLTQLTAAPKSRAQLAEKLRAKDVDEDVIEAVLDRMEDVGLVDDAVLAGMIVRTQVATRGLARRALAQELSRKGIEAEVAQEALDEVDDETERARALELARKKLTTMSRLDEQVRTRRLAGMLARKGYPPSIVWSVVKEAQGSFDPDEAL